MVRDKAIRQLYTMIKFRYINSNKIIYALLLLFFFLAFSPASARIYESPFSDEIMGIPSLDFSLSIETDYQKIKQGESATYTAHLEPLYGWSSEVALSIEGLPPAASVVFTPNSLIPPGEVLIKITTADGTTPDKYALNIKAEGVDLGE